ncbi:hypothetical protein [Hydrogenimonas thermophila]|uniref:Uncharacterized protein n=1 Tax=Hydrogenimonas thermophila TaxID=223786 RepID=A0A1I5LYQ2_9BACT|nr:hypothetical protein [Hydrogenimonas thermophila]SFP02488.1 hypothetical protein SAMN05216234_10488 [Hydrogenimonas thermophila]
MTAAETLKSCNISTVEQLINKIDAVVEIMKDDAKRICISKKIAVVDFDFAFSVSAEATLKTIEKGAKLQGVKRFLNCQNIDIAVNWLLQRIVANIKNTYDKRYKMHFENNGTCEINDYTSKYTIDKQIETEIEKMKKIDKEKIKQGLKKVWKEVDHDDFDIADFVELCEKHGFNAEEILGFKPIVNAQIKTQQVESGRSQLFFDF